MRHIKKLLLGLALLVAFITPMAVKAEETSKQILTNRIGYRQLERIELGKTSRLIPKTYSGGSAQYKASQWDTYSSDYFYQYLNANQKTLYNSIYAVGMNYLQTAENAENYGSYGLSKPIGMPTGMSLDDAEDVIQLVLTNCPQFYFFSNLYGWGSSASGNYVQIGMYSEWVNGSTRATATQQMAQKISSWMDIIKAEKTTIDKEKKAHDLISDNTVYDLYAPYDQSCASVFLGGRSVCAGYAEAFALLCNGLGLDTVCVTSYNHEWNIINLYGNWYNVDVTWDDQDDGDHHDWYFNVNDSAIRNSTHTVEAWWSPYHVPSCVNATVVPLTPILNGVNYSAVYNEEYYLARYPDIGRAFGADSEAILRHFVNNGMSEGRQGISTFDVQSYKRQYADLRNAFGNNLKSYYLHYINNGQREGRKGTGCTSIQGSVTKLNGVDYSAVFDFQYYKTTYSDIARVFGNDDIAALNHFVNNGMVEGRQGIKTFNVTSYIYQYADLRKAFGNNLKSYYLHYMNNGKKEGRKTTGTTKMVGYLTVYNGVDYAAVYDYNDYVAKYSDIKKAFGYDDAKVLAHFVNNGMAEGRQGIQTFEVQSYRKQYVDLRSAFGNNLKSYYLHYINNGQREGRKGTGCNTLQGGVTKLNGVDYSVVYDFNYYINSYSDIMRIYGNDDIGALTHFLNYGMKEGRRASEDFDVNTYANKYTDLRTAFGNNLKSYYLHYINHGKKEGRLAK